MQESQKVFAVDIVDRARAAELFKEGKRIYVLFRGGVVAVGDERFASFEEFEFKANLTTDYLPDELAYMVHTGEGAEAKGEPSGSGSAESAFEADDPPHSGGVVVAAVLALAVIVGVLMYMAFRQ